MAGIDNWQVFIRLIKNIWLCLESRDSRHNHIFFSSVQFEVELQNVKSKVNRWIN
jgi:hypothetical protein